MPMSKPRKSSKEQDRGPGAKKIKLERHLDSNSELVNKHLGSKDAGKSSPRDNGITNR